MRTSQYTSKDVSNDQRTFRDAIFRASTGVQRMFDHLEDGHELPEVSRARITQNTPSRDEISKLITQGKALEGVVLNVDNIQGIDLNTTEITECRLSGLELSVQSGERIFFCGCIFDNVTIKAGDGAQVRIQDSTATNLSFGRSSNLELSLESCSASDIDLSDSKSLKLNLQNVACNIFRLKNAEVSNGTWRDTRIVYFEIHSMTLQEVIATKTVCEFFTPLATPDYLVEQPGINTVLEAINEMCCEAAIERSSFHDCALGGFSNGISLDSCQFEQSAIDTQLNNSRVTNCSFIHCLFDDTLLADTLFSMGEIRDTIFRTPSLQGADLSSVTTHNLEFKDPAVSSETKFPKDLVGQFQVLFPGGIPVQILFRGMGREPEKVIDVELQEEREALRNKLVQRLTGELEIINTRDAFLILGVDVVQHPWSTKDDYSYSLPEACDSLDRIWEGFQDFEPKGISLTKLHQRIDGIFLDGSGKKAFPPDLLSFLDDPAVTGEFVALLRDTAAEDIIIPEKWKNEKPPSSPAKARNWYCSFVRDTLLFHFQLGIINDIEVCFGSNADGVRAARRNYRTLAAQYHPDVNSDEKAVDTFKLITGAYKHLERRLGTFFTNALRDISEGQEVAISINAIVGRGEPKALKA